MNKQIKELWEAANDHSVIMGWDYIVKHDGEDMPPMPEDPETVIQLVTKYLLDTL